MNGTGMARPYWPHFVRNISGLSPDWYWPTFAAAIVFVSNLVSVKKKMRPNPAKIKTQISVRMMIGYPKQTLFSTISASGVAQFSCSF